MRIIGFKLIRNIIAKKQEIARSAIFKISKAELISTYVRLQIKKAIVTKIKKAFVPPEKIFGYKIDYFHLKGLCYLFNEIFINQIYYFQSVKPNPFIIDCGSNIGISVIYFKVLYPDSTILAFEPGHAPFKKLCNTIDINNLKKISVHNKALFNKKSEIDFYYHSENSDDLKMSIIKERRENSSKYSVKTVLLSSYITKTVDLLKMDIEGAELYVIQELVDHNKLHLINEMIIEYHHHIDKQKDYLSQMLQLLESNRFGYQIQAGHAPPYKKGKFQDIMIYAYKKSVFI